MLPAYSKTKNQSTTSQKKAIEEHLVSLKFQKNYIHRAFKVYEKNYGDNYNIEVITEIIARLQNKDKAKKQNKKTKQYKTEIEYEADLTSLKQTVSLLLEKYNKATRQIYSLKQKQNESKALVQANDNLSTANSMLQREITMLKQKNNELLKQNYDLNEQCTDTDKYDNAAREITSLKQNITQKQREINGFTRQVSQLKREKNKLGNECNQLKQENDDLSTANCDLNEECKELKLELNAYDIKDKYNKWVIQNSDYTTWDGDTITDWILGLDKQFIRYENELRKMLKEEEITGADLIDLDKNDLTRFGMKVWRHKKRIIEEIQKLSAQQNNNIQNNDNIIPYNEGKKDTAHIEK